MSDRRTATLTQRDLFMHVINATIDTAKASRGRWKSKDVVGLAMWIDDDEQQRWERMSHKVDLGTMRELAVARIGTANMMRETGVYWLQVVALQKAYEDNPDLMIQVLESAMHKRGQCKIDGIIFDFS